MQLSSNQARDKDTDYVTDYVSMVQTFDPRIPFGSKLTQIQAQLNGLDTTQCAQAAWHLHVMTARTRRLAGTVNAQISDRFLRLEALVASYVTEEVEVPLSLQVWSEGQLRTLIPYLNGGRTPESDLTEGKEGKPRACLASTAASSTDAVEVVNSSEVAEEPEYRVKRSSAGEWEVATEEEAAMLRQHDREIMQEAAEQEEADKKAFQEYEANLAQRWDDWAIRSELDRERPLPSRKRIRVTVCVGSAGGQEIGTANIEGVLDHGQQPTVTFQVEETLLAGTEGTPSADRGPGFVSAQAAPQLATFHRDHVPGLSEDVANFMSSQEGRHFLWQFQAGAITAEEVDARFGTEVAEGFQLWVAVQDDVDEAVRHVGDVPALSGSEQGAGSEASTIPVGDEPDVSVPDRPRPTTST